ncbi:hypothetical protein [Vibrio atypicus]|uniref:hypothetical protein n=1 Tax=Vibrio atypicus TaxID=558271 RepID=UPI00135C109E|nr:hypothetical protein [Vibrio atypicus]
MNNSICNKNRLIDNSHWSNNFNDKNKGIVTRVLNHRLRKLIDTNTYSYIKDINRSIGILSKRALLMYQSRLLRKMLGKPEQYLSLDCDKLVFTMNCSDGDIQHLTSQLTSNIPLYLNSILTVKKHAIGKVNGDCKRENSYGRTKNRPIYNHAYKMTIEGKNKSHLIIYIADGESSKNHKKSIRICYNPNNLNDFEHHVIFGYLKSTLTNRRYTQLMKKARITRIDIGFNMVGVTFPLVIVFPKKGTIKITDEYPRGDCIKETLYLGSKFKSCHTIVYDKIIKEIKFDESSIRDKSLALSYLNSSLLTTRVERRHLPYRMKRILLLTEMNNINLSLQDITFIDPSILMGVPKEVISKLITNKTYSRTQDFYSHFSEKDLEANLLSLDKQWLDVQSSQLLCHYQQLILKAKKPKAKEAQQYYAQRQSEQLSV